MSTTSSGTDRIFELELDLLLGPAGEFSDGELERGWRVYGAELTEHARTHSLPGWRPWGWWRFEAGREEPDRHEAVPYLAACGELTDAEVAEFAARANEARPRIGTGAEHHGPNCRADRDAVELHEAVKRALGR
jgi:hypothetical protein